jgi:hypothetical protein
MKKVFYLILTGMAIGINDVVDGAKNMARGGRKMTQNAANEW